MENNFKSAFIGIVGSPNVGKSTIVNYFIGRKIAIVSHKPQTTRHRITGILTKGDMQMVFLDTPGITEAKNKLGESMIKTAYESTRDVDAILFVLDLNHGIGKRDLEILNKISRGSEPLVVALNKSDVVKKQDITKVLDILRENGVEENIHTVSALTGEGMDELLAVLKTYLIEGPMYYPRNMTSDQPEKQVVSEIIREKALLLLNEEVPHGIGVGVMKLSHRTDKEILDIEANIYCERESHKGIIIGKGASMLKRIGSDSRKDLEKMFGKQVFLRLMVRVKPDWRDTNRGLQDLGYKE